MSIHSDYSCKTADKLGQGKMATGGGFPSISKTSEEIFDSECFNCSQDGKHVEADVFCVECGDYLCKRCLNEHNKFSKLRAHRIKSARKLGTIPGMLHPPTEKCEQHDGRLIDTYCASHDTVGCSVCVSEGHRSCSNVSYIPKVSSGISNSAELKDTQTTADTVKARLDTLKETRQANIESITRQRNEALERAAMYKDELIERIEELGKKTATEIKDNYKKLEETINGELDELGKLIETLEDIEDKLKKSADNETKLFVHLKQCKQYVCAAENLIKTCKSTLMPDACTFNIDNSVETYLKNFESLGFFDENSVYSAEQMSDENIKDPADTSTCRITGICGLDDGSHIIADTNNNCLKKLDKSFQIKSRCALSSDPWGVCQTSSTEVAVTLCYTQKIQFVAVDQGLSLTRSFSASGSGYCRGITCRDGKLYVIKRIWGLAELIQSGYVQVYSLSGTLLQTIQNDHAGSPIFSASLLHIAISRRTSNINVVDFDKGLIILDNTGQLITKITDPELKGAHGVCVLPGDQLLVCGRSSDNVILFDGQGKKILTLLSEKDGLVEPRTLHFDPHRSRLVVGMWKDTIKVFNLVKKRM